MVNTPVEGDIVDRKHVCLAVLGTAHTQLPKGTEGFQEAGLPLCPSPSLGIITNSESPIVVVLSGSMEPAFYRGDILFLTNPTSETYRTGDITVYKIPGASIPIVHRVLETHDVEPKKSTGQPVTSNQKLLTKGDNNYVDDIELYQGLEWLERKHIIGKVRGFCPYIGYVTIAMNDFPQLKYALLGGLGLLALLQRE